MRSKITSQNVYHFQHIPPFIKSADEPDDYFNLARVTRMDLLQRYHKAGARFVFTGHLHYNGGGKWHHPQSSEGDQPLEVVSSSSVGVQLGDDQPGLRLIRVSPTGIKHKYFTLDQLEKDPQVTQGF